MNVNFSSDFNTEEINANKTTLTVTQQINTIMSLTSSDERLDTYYQIFKRLDTNEQYRLFFNINNYMKDVNPYNRDENIDNNIRNNDILSRNEEIHFNQVNNHSYLYMERFEESQF